MTFQVDVKVNIKNWDAVTKRAVQQTSAIIREAQRSNVGSFGRFDSRWQKWLTTKVKQEGKVYRIGTFHRVSFAKVFEYGATSVGKPLLWIRAPSNSQRVQLKGYKGKLFRPGPKNNRRRVLVRPGDRRVEYIGVPQVTIRPRWALRSIAQQQAQRFLERLKHA